MTAKPLDIYDAIIDDIVGSFADRNFAQFNNKTDELRAFIEPYLFSPMDETWENFNLTRAEIKLADVLLAKLNKCVDKFALDAVSENSLGVLIYRLRKKLHPYYHIENLWGRGFALKQGPGPTRVNGKWKSSIPRIAA